MSEVGRRGFLAALAGLPLISKLIAPEQPPWTSGEWIVPAQSECQFRTGGTLKDLLEYGQNFAAQEYENAFNRALENYDRAKRR